MQSLQWGIIGPGNIAHDFARDLDLVRPKQSLRAVLGTDEASTIRFCESFNIELPFTSMEAFIQESGVDIVYIATPHPLHFEQALACLENRIHVLCEKPMTLNQKQAQQLIAMSKLKQRFLMEGMWLRFLPPIQKCLSLIAANRIGELVAVKASMSYKAPKDDNNRYFDPELGGGSLLDLGIYPVFLSHLLLGTPNTISASGRLSTKGVDEFCAILFNYSNKQYALMDSSIVTDVHEPAVIVGEMGMIRILAPWFEKSIGIELQLYGKEKEFFPMEWEGHGLQFEIEEAVHSISKGHIESEYFSHAFSEAISVSLDQIRKQINVVYDNYEQ